MGQKEWMTFLALPKGLKSTEGVFGHRRTRWTCPATVKCPKAGARDDMGEDSLSRSGTIGSILELPATLLKGWGMMAHAADVLSIEPRGLNRVKAAAYVGVSPSLFDEMVRDGRMPQPKTINSRTVWDRRELDDSFDALPSKEECDPWDCVLGA